MTHKQFEQEIDRIYRENSIGEDIVIFGQQKYDFDDDYYAFEIILSLDEHGNIEIDWDYNEGEDDYIIDGWLKLNDMLEVLHKKILEEEDK